MLSISPNTAAATHPPFLSKRLVSGYFFPLKEIRQPVSCPWHKKYHVTGIESSHSFKHQRVNRSSSLLTAAKTYTVITLCIKYLFLFFPPPAAGVCMLTKQVSNRVEPWTLQRLNGGEIVQGRLVNLACKGSSQVPESHLQMNSSLLSRLSVNGGVNRCGFVKMGIESEGALWLKNK